MTTPSKKIAIVDDDPAVSDSLDILLRSCGYETDVFGRILDFEAADKTSYDTILLDVRLPDGDGIAVLQGLFQSGITAPVIIMTGHGDVPMAVRAMRLGASDFVEKPFDPDRLLDLIEDGILQAAEKRHAEQAVVQARNTLERLSAREQQVMMALVAGKPNKVIAHELDLSPRTVEVHRARVMEKTSVGSLSGLVRLAISAGVDPEADGTRDGE